MTIPFWNIIFFLAFTGYNALKPSLFCGYAICLLGSLIFDSFDLKSMMIPQREDEQFYLMDSPESEPHTTRPSNSDQASGSGERKQETVRTSE
eukprot:CAMPEP_0114976398 /NCGR_PEP_ID=MMETSP0216-20121206/2650_1 /TAXON_ID=223996 /ORGANISM="Protocruzia adherens, Strain Boccale" /LENGTH=92 /DNA_ID=CAMNT_0002337321 /DNA_START=702 /DNA_END=980 /DNA_ORIENTATION=-